MGDVNPGTSVNFELCSLHYHITTEMEIKPAFVLFALVTILSLAVLTEAKEYELWRYRRHAPGDRDSKSSSSEEHKDGHHHGEGHKAGVHHANGHSGKLEQKAFGHPVQDHEKGYGGQHGGQKGPGLGGHGAQGGQHGNFGQKGPMNGHLAAPGGGKPGDHLHGPHDDKGHHGR